MKKVRKRIKDGVSIDGVARVLGLGTYSLACMLAQKTGKYFRKTNKFSAFDCILIAEVLGRQNRLKANRKLFERLFKVSLEEVLQEVEQGRGRETQKN